MTDDLEIGRGVTIPGSDLSWSAVRSSGPGGQNVNKVATKVDLRLDLERTAALSAETKERLRLLAGRRLDAEGRLVVTCQSTRSQADNLVEARERLAALVRKALERPRPRRPTRPGRAAVRRRLEAKRRRGARKRDRSAPPDES